MSVGYNPPLPSPPLEAVVTNKADRNTVRGQPKQSLTSIDRVGQHQSNTGAVHNGRNSLFYQIPTLIRDIPSSIYGTLTNCM